MRRSRGLQEKEKDLDFDGVSKPEKKKMRKEKQPQQPAREENENNYLLNLDVLPLELVLKQTTLTTVLALGRTCKRGKERVKQYLRQCAPLDRVREDVKLFRELEDEVEKLNADDFHTLFELDDRSTEHFFWHGVSEALKTPFYRIFADACVGGHQMALSVMREYVKTNSVMYNQFVLGYSKEYQLVPRLGILAAYENGHSAEVVPLLVDWFGITKSVFLQYETDRHGEDISSYFKFTSRPGVCETTCISEAFRYSDSSHLHWCLEKFDIDPSTDTDIDYNSLFLNACKNNNAGVVKLCCEKFSISRSDLETEDILEVVASCKNAEAKAYLISRFT